MEYALASAWIRPFKTSFISAAVLLSSMVRDAMAWNTANRLCPVVQLANDEILTFLHLLPVGYINDGGQHGNPTFSADRIEANLDRKLASVFAPTA
jgi:hypothetical protein